MKKKIRFFLNLCLITTIITNVSSCQKIFNDDITCNFIVSDWSNRNNIIKSDRGDKDSLKEWIKNHYSNPKNNNNIEKWLNLTPKTTEFIENLETKIKYNASMQAIQGFKNLTNNPTFTDFNDLNQQLKNYPLGKEIKIDWEEILKQFKTHYQYHHIPISIPEIKTALLNFYNILTKVYGKKNIMQILSQIVKRETLNKIIACIRTWEVRDKDYDQDKDNSIIIKIMILGNNVFNKKAIYSQYQNGFWATNNILSVISHEYGHVLGHFLELNAFQRQKINNPTNNSIDDKSWNEPSCNPKVINQKLISCTNTKINHQTYYMISSLARNTHINDPIFQRLLAYGIVQSHYGRSSLYDLFAEAFSQWLFTVENQRNIAWEKLDQFFRIDLPKML